MTRQTHSLLESLAIRAGVLYVAAALVVLSMVSGCSTFSAMTPKEKALVIAGVLVTGVLTAAELSNGNHHRRCETCGHLIELPGE